MTNPGEQLNSRTARPELVEGRADCSWFDKYILSEPLMVRQAHHDRGVEGLTMSGSSANATALRD
jgi:hypothetical protein